MYKLNRWYQFFSVPYFFHISFLTLNTVIHVIYRTLLTYVTWFDRSDILRYLAEMEHAGIEALTYFVICDGNNALHLSCGQENLAIVDYFVDDVRMDVNKQGAYRTTSLHHARVSGHIDFVHLRRNAAVLRW